MKTKLDNYSSTKHKIRVLWEGIKELIGLENELKKRIEVLQKDVETLRSQTNQS